jgi:predicted HicB family RNase H-like nuclease
MATSLSLTCLRFSLVFLFLAEYYAMAKMINDKPSRHKTKKDTFSFRLPAETKRLLELAADRTGRTLGGYVDYALKIQFKKDGVA